jgi:uncharacterized protein YukE
MAKAIVDPDELRRFAQDLKRFNDQLTGSISTLQGRLHVLAQTWRDQEQNKFAEEFDQTMKVLKRFMEASSLHIPFLLRKAEHIENYLQQR